MEEFQAKDINKKGITEKTSSFGLRARKAPKKAPIPRPPANFTKQDQLLPTTTAAPQRTWEKRDKSQCWAKKTAKKPLPISQRPVAIPCQAPTCLKTLEPELFRQPILKISFPEILEKIKPEGIEPKR